jgi:hypothetical protein
MKQRSLLIACRKELVTDNIVPFLQAAFSCRLASDNGSTRGVIGGQQHRYDGVPARCNFTSRMGG